MLPPRDTAELKQSKPPLPPPITKGKSSTATNQFKKPHPLAMEDSTCSQETENASLVSVMSGVPKLSEARKKKPPPTLRKKPANQIYEEIPDTLSSADLEHVDSRLPASKTAAGSSKPKKIASRSSYEEIDSFPPTWASGHGYIDAVPSNSGSQSQISNAPLQDHYVKLSKTTMPTQDVLHSGLESAGILLVSGQLNVIQNKLADIVNQIDAVQTRQSVFETELSALKMAELPLGDVGKTSYVNASMSSAEVRECSILFSAYFQKQ